MSASLTPSNSPKVKRKISVKRPRAVSHLPPVLTIEAHNAALHAIRSYLKGRTSYDSFPVSFRLIVLDSKLEVRKALQCLLLNGMCLLSQSPPHLTTNTIPPGVVSAPLWNSDRSCFAGMFTVSDIIHLIQYYYKSSTYEGAVADVETLRLESLRGADVSWPSEWIFILQSSRH